MAPEFLRRCLYGVLLVFLLVPAADAQRSRGKSRRPPPKVKAAKPEPFSPYVLGPAKTPAKAPPKSAAKRPPVKPAAPQVSEADLVTGAADLSRQTDEALTLALHEHFAVCDLDGNEWLSLREAEITLALGREEYQRLDVDRDGRLFEAELAPEKAEILARLGALPPPPRRETTAEAPAPEGALPTAPDRLPRPDPRRPYPSPAQLLGRYDLDHSGGLDASEVQALFSEVALPLSAELVAAQMDPDDSGQLEALELVPLCFLVARHLPDALKPRETAGVFESPMATPGGAAVEEAQEPELAPRTHFSRLDADGDGAIDDTDLRALQSPARLGVRVEAVLSALDADGDGRLSEAEFRRAMGIPEAPGP